MQWIFISFNWNEWKKELFLFASFWNERETQQTYIAENNLENDNDYIGVWTTKSISFPNGFDAADYRKYMQK